MGLFDNLRSILRIAATSSLFERLFPRTTLTVRGRFLFDTSNAKIILRGINLPLLDDWSFPGSDKLAELEQSGANCVRIQWYKNYGNAARPAFAVQDLHNFLAKCAVNRIIPIVGLWDLTCGRDPNLLNSQLLPWWTTEPVLSMLKSHRKYIILNLANELGVYRWAGTPTEQAAALQNYMNQYKSAITSIRNAGLDMPIMIDAPDCGTSISAFTAIGQGLVDHDPKRNLLFSAHAYWAAYDGTSEIANSVAANLPIIFGEVANKQDEDIENGACYYDLDGTNQNHRPATGFKYQDLLETLNANEIGWLAWAWWKDQCASRQMTTTGNFADLTVYGNDITNNASYGLKNSAVRSDAFS